ncbi:MAG: SDR family NAD(P)-dependent oxidoreductase, partial [Trueperaceae bacterium]
MQHGILISGASTGIGRACALDLAARGVRVFAGVRRTEDGDALRAAGGDGVVPVLLDVTDGATIAGTVEAIAAANGERA